MIHIALVLLALFVICVFAFGAFQVAVAIFEDRESAVFVIGLVILAALALFIAAY